MARNTVLDIKDPMARTQGLEFLSKLSALPFAQQQTVLNFLQGQKSISPTTAALPAATTGTDRTQYQAPQQSADPLVEGLLEPGTGSVQEETGINTVLCQMVFGDMRFDDASRSIDLFGREIIPAFS